jgi:hypothetical protein
MTVRRLLSLIDYHNMLNEFLQWKHMCMCYNLFQPQQAKLPCYRSDVTWAAKLYNNEEPHV